MSVYANLVVGVPYGTEGKKRWIKVGAVVRPEHNDETLGPGLVIMLDRHFNPAGVPIGNDPTSVAISTYWPKDKPAVEGGAPTPKDIRRKTFDPNDDDTPF